MEAASVFGLILEEEAGFYGDGSACVHVTERGAMQSKWLVQCCRPDVEGL
jgi:hypothetical protein